MTKKEEDLKIKFLDDYWTFIEKWQVKHKCKWYGNLVDLKIKAK